MKLKLLSLILILFLIPGSLVLSACKKEEGYEMSSLKSDFYSVAENEADNIVKVNNSLKFDYSKHNNGEAFLQNIIANEAPYKELAKYNMLFENIIEFPCEYIEICSSTSAELSLITRNNLKSELDAFHKSMRDVSTSIDLLAEGLKIAENIRNVICLERYKNLLLSYETLYQTSSQLSNTISTIYYKDILVNSNPEIGAVSLSDFDAGTVVRTFRGRLLFQKSNLTQIFVEKYICGGDFAKEISTSETTLDLTNYNNNIKAITLAETITEQQMVEKANHENNKTNFYNLAIKAYNLQEILSNDATKFGRAAKEISYVYTTDNEDKASAYDKICVEIIDGYDFALGEYNEVLANMVSVMV